MVCPCKGCVDRALMCHSVCEKYIAWKKEHVRIAKIQRQQKPYEVRPSDFIGTTPPPGKHIKKRKKRWGS